MTFIFSIVLINLVILIFHEYLARFYNLYDEPDDVRKKHSFSVPLTGGIIVFFNIAILNLINNDLNFLHLFFTLVFIIGYVDDKIDLNPNKKLIFIFAVCLINVILLDTLQIKSLKFAFLPNIELNNYFSYIFPAICILIFVNALNMFDGANLQVVTYTSFIFIILFFYSQNTQYLIYLIPLITFAILNYKSRSFLGDSGSIFLGYFISINIIENYNLGKILYCEDIFLIMFLPGVDMSRLFIERIYNKKNPFIGDLNHIHHLFKNRFNKHNSFILILFLALFPLLSSLIIGKFLSLITSFLIYFLSIYYLRKV